MPDVLRLRQVCLAVPRLPPVLADLQAIFALSVCHRDPGLARYGLENALMPVGSRFLELVAPVRADTAAGRFISRTRGHGGYMAIFQARDPQQRKAHAAAMGIRTAHEIDHASYQSVQLHPRDCRASFIEFGYSTGGEDVMGAWWPAGPHWQAHVRPGETRRLLGIEMASPVPDDLAAHWSRIVGVPLTDDDADGSGAARRPVLRFDDAKIGFRTGESECLDTVVLEVLDPTATLERAVECGCRVVGETFHLGGVNLRVVGPRPG